jgi:hypothetical protein
MDADACPRGAASETKSRACLSSLTPKAFGADGTDVFFCTIAQHFVLGFNVPAGRVRCAYHETLCWRAWALAWMVAF